MLISDWKVIGKKLAEIRKNLELTQYDVANAAGLSYKTYADAERGNVNVRMGTILKICDVLAITPDVLFTEENPDIIFKFEKLYKQLQQCNRNEQETALKLLSVYLDLLDTY